MNLNESQTKSEHEIRRNSYHKLLYRSPSLTSCRICDDGFIASTTGVLACVVIYLLLWHCLFKHAAAAPLWISSTVGGLAHILLLLTSKMFIPISTQLSFTVSSQRFFSRPCLLLPCTYP